MINGNTPTGAIPVKVPVSILARVTAGFANEVDEVNQYAAVMYAAMLTGANWMFFRPANAITLMRPKVATRCEPSIDLCVRFEEWAAETWREKVILPKRLQKIAQPSKQKGSFYRAPPKGFHQTHRWIEVCA